jgi:hypothetical protein
MPPSLADPCIKAYSGSLAIFAAIRRASSLESNFAADLRPLRQVALYLRKASGC